MTDCQQHEIEAYQALREMEDEERARREVVLSEVRDRVDQTIYGEIERCIEDSDQTHTFAIVDKAAGVELQSDYAFGAYFVDQYQDGGIAGDSFAGTVCIPIGREQYLEFHYET